MPDKLLDQPARFSRLPAEVTHIDFANNLAYDEDFNIYTYRNFYNGGGIAAGDINNDGLVDLYFTANMLPNQLYLNKGDFQFEDITESSGVGGTRAWSTGVTMADINGDGWLDIYVCNSGDIDGSDKQNELFINQGSNDDGDITFSEESASYGLDDQGYGTHAVFFDADKDGDLDCYLLNNSYRSIFDFNRMKNQRPIRDELGGDKFFRNDGDIFTDISEEAGIYGSEIGFGLGVTVGDVNRDGWLDMFVSNDFFERDYLYINNGDGTFTEDLENQIQSLSVASMGADMADLNNDGYPEIFVTEMLPEDDARYKTKMTFENWDRYQYNLNNGYYHQFTRNVLQLNNGDGTFSEIGRLAGVEATDWSWGALIADFDNDGLSDLFVANGLYKDIIDQDYINYVSNEEIVKQVVSQNGVNYKHLIDTIPSTPISNYLFQNQGNLQFTNVAEEWGLAEPSHSNGAVYADLNNDGFLDLVVNNVNAPAFIYRNEHPHLDGTTHYLKVSLKGSDKNLFAIGAKVTLVAGNKRFYQENIPVRGFQSSVDHRLNFGLGFATIIDSLNVIWPDDTQTSLTGIRADQTIEVTQDSAQDPSMHLPDTISRALFRCVSDQISWSYEHKENDFIDFDRDRLIYHMVSTEGPPTCSGDVNGDGLMDFFIGGAANSAASLYIQNADGNFVPTNAPLFGQDKSSEDVDCQFFDCDNDGDLDLYVARGGNEFLLDRSLMADQLYINQGSGHFTRSPQFLPTFKAESSGCVEVSDYDRDGDLDLFVGVRIIPGYYGVSGNGYILNNDGKGKFTNVSAEVAPDMERLGMITDALWMDIDRDADQDLLVVGEWMPVVLFENRNGRFERIDLTRNGERTNGWWNCIESGDFDNDGDLDLVLGNHGLNSRFEASTSKPLYLHVNDFDDNGTPDPIISQYNGDKAYPLVLRQDLVMQLPVLKKKYPGYADYKEQTIEDMFSPEQIRRSVKKEAYELQTSLLINQGNGDFEWRVLPVAAQFSPTYAISVDDFDQDGHLDILLGGNMYGVKPEVGRYDASYGLLLKGDGQQGFKSLFPRETGFRIKGQVRDFLPIQSGEKKYLIAAINNAPIEVFEYGITEKRPLNN